MDRQEIRQLVKEQLDELLPQIIEGVVQALTSSSELSPAGNPIPAVRADGSLISGGCVYRR